MNGGVKEHEMTDRFTFGICSWCLPSDQETACGMAAEIGLDGMEVDIGLYEAGLPLSLPENQQRLLAAASATGIEIPTIGANTLCKHGMSTPSKSEIVREVLAALVEAAAALDIRLLQLPSFIDGFITNEDELVLTAEHLKFVCRRAADSGLTVGTENAISTEDNLRLLEMVDEPNLRVYFDTSNPYWFGNMDTLSMIEPLSPLFCELHVKDESLAPNEAKPHFVKLGTGGSSFHKAAAAILASEYEGWIHLENSYRVTDRFTESDSLAALRTDVEIMRSTFAETGV